MDFDASSIVSGAKNCHKSFVQDAVFIRFKDSARNISYAIALRVLCL